MRPRARETRVGLVGCIVSPVYVRVVIIVVINDSSRLTAGLNTHRLLHRPSPQPHRYTENNKLQRRTNTKARPDKYKSGPVPDRAEPCQQCRDREPSRIRCLFVYDPAQYVYLSLAGHWPMTARHQKTGQ